MKRIKVIVEKKHRHARDMRRAGEIYDDYLPQDIPDLVKRGVVTVLKDFKAPQELYKQLIKDPIEEIKKPVAKPTRKKPAAKKRAKKK